MEIHKERGKTSNQIKSPQPGEGVHSKLVYLALLFILLFAITVRIAALMDFTGSIYFDFLLWDERIYYTWATKIANGTFLSKSVYEFAPLPAYMMALIYKIFSPNIFYVRIMNVILGVLTCLLIYMIGKEIAGRIVGLLSCLIACLYKPFIFYSIVPMKTTLEIFLFGLTIYLFVSLFNQKDPDSQIKDSGIRTDLIKIDSRSAMIRIGFLGLVVGLLLNVRPNFILIVPIMPLMIIWYYRRNKNFLKIFAGSVGIYVIGFCIATLPFVSRNYIIGDKFALTTSQAGFNLYIGNNLKNPDPYYRPVPFASSSPFEQGSQFTIEASRRVGRHLSPDESSRYWINEVVKIALDNPKALAWKLCQKSLAIFNQFEADDHYDIDFVSKFVPFLKLPFLSFWFLFPFGIAGMALNGFSVRKVTAVSIVFMLYVLTLIIFFANGRYRLLTLVILIPTAALGIINIILYFRKKQLGGIVVYLLIITAFFIIEFLPVQASDDNTAYYNTHAIILDSKGFENEAMLYWQKSSEMNRSFSVYANLSLAGKYYRKGNVQLGNQYLDKISDDSFAAASKYELRGDVLLHQNLRADAIQAYEKSLEINSGQRRPRMKLINLYKRDDPRKAFEEEKKLKEVSSYYDLF